MDKLDRPATSQGTICLTPFLIYVLHVNHLILLAFFYAMPFVYMWMFKHTLRITITTEQYIFLYKFENHGILIMYSTFDNGMLGKYK